MIRFRPDGSVDWLHNLAKLGRSRGYWLTWLLFTLISEGGALYYQYVLEYEPCVLCIQVRIWLAGAILIALLMVLVCRQRLLSILGQLLFTLVMVGLVERSYLLLGTERGWVMGDCNFDLGLPSWLALEQWWPTVFKVQASCGYTPVLLFGMTTAEALMVISVLMLLLSAALTVAVTLRKPGA